ncbi:hypothetical protein DL96DRAFT_1591488 [Flagelloscypha sp. PMI_526]|nr:hypothetical protein DL96DRAFT_1591488 [Flagelloscypha sp. PMI_526]
MGKVVRVDLSTLCLLLSLSHGHHLTLHLPYPGTLFLSVPHSGGAGGDSEDNLLLHSMALSLSTSHLLDSPPLVYS